MLDEDDVVGAIRHQRVDPVAAVARLDIRDRVEMARCGAHPRASSSRWGCSSESRRMIWAKPSAASRVA